MSKKTKTEKVLDFFAGKGFYIILIACVTAIGVSGYMLLFHNSAPDTQPNDSQIEWLEPSLNAPLLEVTKTPAPSPSASSKPVDGIPDDEGVLQVLKPTGIEISPVPPETKPEAAGPASPAASAEPEPEPTPEPSPSQAPAQTAETAPKFFWPVPGTVSVPYAYDELVYSRTMGDWRAHVGIDIAAEPGTQVMASADGTVKDIYLDPKLGNCVLIDHGAGLQTLYGNLQENATVSIDAAVSAGDIIGGIGATAAWEASDESHLHFEVFKDGASADPLEFLPER